MADVDVGLITIDGVDTTFLNEKLGDSILDFYYSDAAINSAVSSENIAKGIRYLSNRVANRTVGAPDPVKFKARNLRDEVTSFNDAGPNDLSRFFDDAPNGDGFPQVMTVPGLENHTRANYLDDLVTVVDGDNPIISTGYMSQLHSANGPGTGMVLEMKTARRMTDAGDPVEVIGLDGLSSDQVTASGLYTQSPDYVGDGRFHGVDLGTKDSLIQDKLNISQFSAEVAQDSDALAYLKLIRDNELLALKPDGSVRKFKFSYYTGTDAERDAILTRLNTMRLTLPVDQRPLEFEIEDFIKFTPPSAGN